MGKGFFKNEMGFGQDFYTLKFYDPVFRLEKEIILKKINESALNFVDVAPMVNVIIVMQMTLLEFIILIRGQQMDRSGQME